MLVEREVWVAYESTDSSALGCLCMLDVDMDGFTPLVLGAFSILFLPLCRSAWALSAAFLMLLPLPDLLISGSSAVRGGLGGARVGGALAVFAGVEALRLSFERAFWSRSVGSGVYSDSLGFTTSSRLPTASLLCALEKFGYDVLDFTSDVAVVRRSISGTSIVTFLAEREDCRSEVDDLSGRGESLPGSLLSSLRLRCSFFAERGRSLSLALVAVLSRSRSYSFLRLRGSSSRDGMTLLHSWSRITLVCLW